MTRININLLILSLNCLSSFEPPGQMSAGMSCDVGVTFKPMVRMIYSFTMAKVFNE